MTQYIEYVFMSTLLALKASFLYKKKEIYRNNTLSSGASTCQVQSAWDQKQDDEKKSVGNYFISSLSGSSGNSCRYSPSFFLLNIALTTGISSQSEIHESFQQYLNNNIRKKNFKIILDIFEKRNIFAV